MPRSRQQRVCRLSHRTPFTSVGIGLSVKRPSTWLTPLTTCPCTRTGRQGKPRRHPRATPNAVVCNIFTLPRRRRGQELLQSPGSSLLPRADLRGLRRARSPLQSAIVEDTARQDVADRPRAAAVPVPDRRGGAVAGPSAHDLAGRTCVAHPVPLADVPADPRRGATRVPPVRHPACCPNGMRSRSSRDAPCLPVVPQPAVDLLPIPGKGKACGVHALRSQPSWERRSTVPTRWAGPSRV